MKKGKKKNNIIDRAKSNMEKNRKEQKVKNFFKVLLKYLNTFRGRFGLLVLFTTIGFAVILGKVYSLQTGGGKEYREKGEKQYSSQSFTKAKRGRISTSDGQVLAYDNEEFIINLNPSLIEQNNIDIVLEMLKKYIPELEIEKYKSEYLKDKQIQKKYLKVEHIIPYNTKIAIESEIDNDIKNVKKKKKEGYKRKFKGVTFETLFTRNYIQNNVFQETLGYVNNENKGVYGIEKYYDKELSGKTGIITGLRKIPKALQGIMKLGNIKKSEDRKEEEGKNLVLTIDSFLQYTLNDELEKAYVSHNANSTMGILIEVETGKILAMSSYPKAEDKVNIKNRPITDYFEPGSIFKPITVAIGLETKAINENTKLTSEGSIKVADKVLREHDNEVMGTLSLADAIAKSSNVVMVKIEKMISKEVFLDYLLKLGLGMKTGIDTYFEMAKSLSEVKKIRTVERATMSYGQGISMTQIQILMALNTVINNGKMMKPYLVDRIEDSKGNIIKQNKPVMERKIFSDEVSRLNRKYMEASVNRGTSEGAYIPGYRVGGKTGTAKKAKDGIYQDKSYVSSFFGFFPVDKPKYAVLITINEPKGSYYGSEVALPSARNVLQRLIDYKKIQPNGKVKTIENNAGSVQVEKKKDLGKIKQDFNKNIMPDLTGISLREFLSIYPQGKFSQYEVTGSGAIISQFPEKGTKLDKKSKIQIMLE
ncbi:penicillin-binding transpeptidase domain-containing protein [Leptotrichia shahii]|uniref:penicillin-binding transpeptidase domain-containing protein n=1 Tax=Leptotrichia shahii TaxID=157691 RepID=UPI0028D1E56E|nr:penicillin-binding transpeptidase domain-containing protein [Leptotrichia shahii]